MRRSVSSLVLLAIPLILGVPESRGQAKPREMTIAQALEELKWEVAGIDVKRRTISVGDVTTPPSGKRQAGKKEEGDPTPLRLVVKKDGPACTGLGVSRLPLAADAKVSVDGKEAKLDDLKRGMRVSLQLVKGGVEVAAVEAQTKGKAHDVPPFWKLDAADAKKKTLSITSREAKVTLKGLEMGEGARVSAMEFKGGPATGSAQKLEDLAAEVSLAVKFTVQKGKIVVFHVVTAK